MLVLIVMPPALKHMMPNIVGSFIGLLKDTVLVSIIGLFGILGMLRAVSQDLPWRGLHKEPLFFGAMLFFIICFAMSKYSRHLERKLSAGANRCSGHMVFGNTEGEKKYIRGQDAGNQCPL